MSSVDAEWITRELAASVKLLSESADVQIDWVGRGHPDDLALDFDNFFSAARDNDLLHPAAHVPLASLDEQLKAMSRHGDLFEPDLWSPEGLRTNPKWDEVRARARAASAVLTSAE